MKANNILYVVIFSLTLILVAPSILIAQDLQSMVNDFSMEIDNAYSNYTTYLHDCDYSALTESRKLLSHSIDILRDIDETFHLPDSINVTSYIKLFSEIKDGPDDVCERDEIVKFTFNNILRVKKEKITRNLWCLANDTNYQEKKLSPKTYFTYKWKSSKNKFLSMTMYPSDKWNRWLNHQGLSQKYFAVEVELLNNSDNDYSINPMSDSWTIITNKGVPYLNIGFNSYDLIQATQELPQSEQQKLFINAYDILSGVNTDIIVMFPKEVGQTENWKRLVFKAGISSLGKVNFQKIKK